MRQGHEYSTRPEPQEAVPEDISLISTTASHQQEDTLQEKNKALQLSLKRGGFGGFDFTEEKKTFLTNTRKLRRATIEKQLVNDKPALHDYDFQSQSGAGRMNHLADTQF